jgi:hypothetical protein
MTYSATEQAALGHPVEMYEFVQAGVFTRVTSAMSAQVLAGQTYVPLAGLGRSEIKQDSEANAGEITISCPSNFEIAIQFRAALPSSLPNLTIFARHANDIDGEGVAVWKGSIISANLKSPRNTELRGMPTTRRLQSSIPRVVFSAVCNNQLYDPQCGVDRQDYRYENAVALVSADGFEITIPNLRDAAEAINTTLSLGLSVGQIDNFWQRGLIRAGNPTEIRMVVQVNVGADVNKVRVNKPFRDLSIGSGVEIFAGCDHSAATCNAKFKNFITPGVPASGLRFGGYPYVPTLNPFNIELDAGMES